MQGSKAALRYAKAMLGLAKDQNCTKEVFEDMVQISDTIDGSGDLRVFLSSPVIGAGVKKDALHQIFKNVHPMTGKLLDLLVEGNRDELLYAVASRYQSLYNQLNNVQVAQVITAVPLSSKLKGKMQEKVKQLTGNQAKIENTIDDKIIGGFILKVGDIEYNASVKAQLNDLEREFKNNTYVSKL